jgi:hypothetical protein
VFVEGNAEAILVVPSNSHTVSIASFCFPKRRDEVVVILHL